MDQNMVAIIVGAVFAGVTLAAYYGTARLLEDDKRKLKSRLSTEGQEGTGTRKPMALKRGVKKSSAALMKYAALRRMDGYVRKGFPAWTLEKFLTLAGAHAVVGLLVVESIFGSGLMGVVGALAAAGVPFWMVGQRVKRKVRKVTEQLPEAVDFLVRVLRAGHSLSSAMRMMGEELPKPLSEEFKRCYDEHSLGQPLEESLKEMSLRLNSTDFSFFVTAVLVQRQTGGDLAEILNNISNMVRQRVRLSQNVKAKTAEGRFTGYILVAFPMVMFFLAYFMNPEYAGKLIHTGTGLGLLGTAFVLEVLGLVAIRRITTIRV